MKRIVVTGASSGIGLATALALSCENHSLVLTARRGDKLAEVSQACMDLGAQQVLTYAADINEPTTPDQIARMVRSLPGTTVLVNNAGSAVFGDFVDTPLPDQFDQLGTNLLAPIVLTHALLTDMVEAKSGQIINVLSLAAEHVFPGAALYSASKAGLRQFAKVIRAEYRAQGIRLTNLLPGATATPLWQGEHPPFEQMVPAETVAAAIAQIVNAPEDHVVEELVLAPLLGVL